MAKRFNFDEAITTDIKGAASDSYSADEVTRQLLKIGNNINQIAIVANTSRKNESELPNYYLKRITDYQDEIMKLLKSLLLAVTNAESENEESDKNNGG